MFNSVAASKGCWSLSRRSSVKADSARPSGWGVRLRVLPVSVVLLYCTVSGCYNGPSGPMVYRTSPDEEIDLSGYWNDVDSRLVSEEMIGALLGRPWLQACRDSLGRKPVVVVGHIANKSHEHIPAETFTKDLEMELINSGQVTFVAGFSQRGQLEEEKQYQARHASVDSQKAMGKAVGADFILLGQINSILDGAEDLEMKYYQVELELISVETGEKVWIGQKKIKKVIERADWEM